MRVIGKLLFGSQTYHLDGPQSDKDYKVIVVPEFIDLYNGKDKFSLPIGYDDPEHYSALDFRKFDSSLRKGNINVIDLIFSPELEIYDKLFISYFELARQIYSEGYATYIWDYFFASAKGRTMNSLKRYNDSEETRRKGASRALWTLNFLNQIFYNYYRITPQLYNYSEIYEYPRKIRYENYDFSNKEEEWSSKFDFINELAKNDIRPCTYKEQSAYFQCCENELRMCAQKLVAESIKKELESR